MLRLGWFSTGRGPGSRNLLKAVMDRKLAGDLDVEIAFVFCNWSNEEADNPKREQRQMFFDMVEGYGIPLVTAAAASLSRDFNVNKPYFFNRKEAKDHGEGGSLVGYKPQDGDRVIIIEDVITAGTAVRETVPILQAAAKVTIPDMFISVNRCEVGQHAGKTAVMEVKEEFGINVHAIITVADIHEYLQGKPEYASVLSLMDQYMEKYCIL